MWLFLAPFIYLAYLLVELCFLAAELFLWGCLMVWEWVEDLLAERRAVRASESPAVLWGYHGDAIDGTEGLEGRTERLEVFW